MYLISSVENISAIGVEGLGTEESKLALFQGEERYRGIVCVKPIKDGEIVLRVPIRVAVVNTEEDSNILYEVGKSVYLRISSKIE